MVVGQAREIAGDVSPSMTIGRFDRRRWFAQQQVCDVAKEESEGGEGRLSENIWLFRGKSVVGLLDGRKDWTGVGASSTGEGSGSPTPKAFACSDDV